MPTKAVLRSTPQGGRYSGGNDILRLQATSVRDTMDLNFACIGADFAAGRKVTFDQQYRRAPFGHACERVRRGCPWNRGHPMLAAQAGAR